MYYSDIHSIIYHSDSLSFIIAKNKEKVSGFITLPFLGVHKFVQTSEKIDTKKPGKTFVSV